MAKWFLALLLLLAAALAAFYWWLFRPQARELEAARHQLVTEQQAAAALRSRLAELESARATLLRSSSDLEQKVAATTKELEALRSTQDELVGQLRQEIADNQVKVEQFRDQIRVEMVDEILFDSGEETLKPEGVAVIRKVANVIGKAEDRRIEVHGHTDDVPIVGALAKRFASNWELSSARATNVVRFLQDQAKIDPRRLTASGHAEYQPKTPNDSDQGRRSNRRIEILLGPAPRPAPTGGPAHLPGPAGSE